MKKTKLFLGISCGDINGVGIELVLKTFSHNKLLDLCIPILYVPVEVVLYYKELLKCEDFTYNLIKDVSNACYGRFNIIETDKNDVEISVQPGENTEFAAKIALDSLQLAVADLNNNKLDSLVTLPVNKKNISLVENTFVGHTEYLLKNMKNKYENLMFLCSESLKIATVTNHLPISKVASSINQDIVSSKLKILLHSLRQDFLIKNPKIAVLGLNPHAGDDGLIGDEDQNIISPIIKTFFNSGELVYGPFPADGFFGSRNYQKYDAVLGMYHDQALVPFKHISFGRGVNYTAGLPVIRVSPDHGVAYDIAGCGKANTHSFLSSISLAITVFNNRLMNSQKKNRK